MSDISRGGRGLGKGNCCLTAFTLHREKGTYLNILVQIHQLLAGY